MARRISADQANSTRVVVVGARSVRQGTGPFVVRAFHRAGARVVGLVGTSWQTVDQARRALSPYLASGCAGEVELRSALAAGGVDVVAVCSPYRFHATQLLEVAAAGVHCLCEKPLCWPDEPGPDGRRPSDQVIAAFRGVARLEVVNQWPTTLPAFDRLCPDARREPISRFEMGLSPTTHGRSMIIDAGPHFVGMLHALCGPGELVEASVVADGSVEGASRLELVVRYQHGQGRIGARLSLERSRARPRPAWYAINGERVDRRVVLPAYRQSLVHEGREVALEDPLEAVVRGFLAALERGRGTDGAELVAMQRDLRSLVDAFDRACRPGG